jgi:peptidoglycan/xylan/chitin deacetylase (PgdA/CDA1 family)
VAGISIACLVLSLVLLNGALSNDDGPADGSVDGRPEGTEQAALNRPTDPAMTATVPVNPAAASAPTGAASPATRPSLVPAQPTRAAATPTPTPEATDPPTPEATIRPDAPTLAGEEPGQAAVVRSGTSGRREVALTFDGGDDRGNAEAILDELQERGIVASFGITGAWATANPDLVERMVAEGHMVFNHTWSHRSFTGQSTGTGDPGTDYRMDEMTRTQQAIEEIAGYDVRPYWRPPYGDLGPQTLTDMATAGYGITVMWSVDSLGWKEGETGQSVTERVLGGVEPGAIILLHVGQAAEADFDALPAILDGLEADGYEFVTVEQVLQP